MWVPEGRAVCSTGRKGKRKEKDALVDQNRSLKRGQMVELGIHPPHLSQPLDAGIVYLRTPFEI